MTENNFPKLDIYINYPGDCERAFKFYEQYLGGKIRMMTFHDQPPPQFSRGVAQTSSSRYHRIAWH